MSNRSANENRRQFLKVGAAAAVALTAKARAEDPPAPFEDRADDVTETSEFQWRDDPATVVFEEVAKRLELRPTFDDDAWRRLAEVRVNLLARGISPGRLLRRIGELTDTDVLLIGDRLLICRHGAAPAAFILNNEMARLDHPDAPDEIRRVDCDWQDITLAALCERLSRAFGEKVVATDDIQTRQDLVSIVGSNMSLDQAAAAVAEQLACPLGWQGDTLVIGRAGPRSRETVRSAQPTTEKKARPDRPGRPLRLSGEAVTIKDLAGLTKTLTGREVIASDRKTDESGSKLWADGPAMDVLAARAMWAGEALQVTESGQVRMVRAGGETDAP